MITQERINTFIQSFDVGNTDFLNELEQFALKTNVPIIRPQTQSFLIRSMSTAGEIMSYRIPARWISFLTGWMLLKRNMRSSVKIRW